MADDEKVLTPEEQAAADAASQRPGWLPENFKEPEELARAYDETRREMNRLQSQAETDRREFAEALEVMRTEQEQRAQRMTDPSQDPRIQAYQRAVDEGDASAQLAITLDLNRQLIAQELEAANRATSPQIQAMQEAQRTQQIDLAETQAAEYARSRGLDYDASKDDVVDALRSLYGDQLLPATGDVTTYVAAMRNAVDIVTAQALVADIQSGEAARREKLSAMTTTPGASGRLATGSPDEQAEWDKVKNAPAGSYSELMALQARRG